MSTLELGSYVTHDKLPDLGPGEVLACDESVTRIRFAAGERNFRTDMVAKHLTVTAEAPARPAPAKSARRAKSKT